MKDRRCRADHRRVVGVRCREQYVFLHGAEEQHDILGDVADVAPEHRGIAPHHTSPPLVPEEFAEFCAAMVRRYASRAGVAARPAEAALG